MEFLVEPIFVTDSESNSDSQCFSLITTYGHENPCNEGCAYCNLSGDFWGHN